MHGDFFFYSIVVEPNILLTHEFNITPPRWPGDLNGLRIAVLADIHAGGLWIEQNKIREMVQKTNAAKPDLIVLVGDYVNNHKHECPYPPEEFAKELAKLRAPLGVYSVLGNHDWAYGGDRITAAFRENGLAVLQNNSVKLSFKNHIFWLTGIEDLFTRKPNAAYALRAVPIDAPNLVITHDPNIFPQIPERVNLTIAGHTHGGQVWLPLLHTFAPQTVGAREPYVKDIVVQRNGMLFISVGIGNSVFPIRFLNAPEISVLNLLSK